MFFAMDKPIFDDMSNGELLLADALAHLLDCYQEYYIDKDGNVCHKEQVDGDDDYSYSDEQPSMGMAAEEDATYE